MIKVVGVGSVEERLRRLEHAVNFSEENRPFPCVGSEEAFTTAAPAIATGVNVFGGVAVDRSVYRELLPDFKWYAYAYGLVDPADANTATIRIQYVGNALGLTSIGSGTAAGAGFVKLGIGPFDVFAAAVNTETTPMLVLTAQKNAGAAGALINWNIWLRYLPAKQ